MPARKPHARKAPTAPGPAPPTATPRDRGPTALLFILLLGAALFAYQPAWHGGFVWDDDAHVTRPELQSVRGLRSIWLEPGTTQQYYPLAHSAFWLLHRIFGEATTGYHVVNIVLHALSALVLALLLRRLDVPGAPLAAVIFALHPVHVESVAWITELKNTLSGVFYLLSALFYIQFDATRRRLVYVLALACFALALMTKTVTATLPAAVLVLFWWRRGTVRWREDVLPLSPFFGAAVAAGLTTAWVERHYVGAQGFEFELSLVERFLVAGRAAWFYAGKLAWPSTLTFIYPRWTIDGGAAWQYAFPIAAFALLAVLWRLRRRSRAPLAAALIFGGTLFPALGFFDVYPFRYSFVADHFQYLASIPLIALFAAALTATISPKGHTDTGRSLQNRTIRFCVPAVICLALGLLTWQQSHQYVSAEALYRATLERNPSCWMCHNNLAKMRFDTSADRDKALAHVEESLRINPRSAEGQHNRGVLLRLMGRHAEALRAQQEAVRLAPTYAEAHNELGANLQTGGRLDDALKEYAEALRLKPRYAEAHVNLATALTATNRTDAALEHLRTAMALQPDYAPAHDALGTIVARSGRMEEAIGHFDTALRLDPRSASAHNDRATALAALGRAAEAEAEYAEAVRLNPNDARFHDNLGYLLLQLGRNTEALARFTDALSADPDFAPARLNLANLLMDARRPTDAIPHYLRVLARPLGGIDIAQVHNNLGIAYATTGRPAEAIAEFEAAVRLRPDFAQARSNLARARRR